MFEKPTGVQYSGNDESTQLSKAGLYPRNTVVLDEYCTPASTIKLQAHAANSIKKAWKCYVQRRTFEYLKNSIYQAERSITADILRRISPNEGKLLNDTAIQSRVRFRFGGCTFPPKILFKIYTKGMGVQYLSGHKMILPGSQAAQDSYTIMGHRAFKREAMSVESQCGLPRIVMPYEVTDKMEYVHYMNSLDYHTPQLGGRNNGWRELANSNAPNLSFGYTMSQGSTQKPYSSARLSFKPRRKLTTKHCSEMGLENVSNNVLDDGFGLLFEWTNQLSVDHLRDYTLE
ncbi:hypothetical protein BASA61_006739 [Batrachochytrium salamandrivorans]|nr:hypothetical protein BASA61_006739 [Batrachochytrium salamandrivorans]